jgi:MSHA biogenesis protein MshI
VFSFFKRKNSADQAVGIGYHPDGVSLAHVAFRQDALSLEHIEFRAVASADGRKEVLKKMVAEARLKGMPAFFVLDSSQYSLLQIEAPEVPPEELKNAVRWRIKDMIDFHLDDAEIEIINLPDSKRAGSQRLMYAIATRTSVIESVATDLDYAGLESKAIDISELALRNMTFADAEENRAGALLYLSEHMSLIEICDNGSLCLSRHINLDFGRVDLSSPETRMEIMDLLSLEVQRSLDYYESQFANGAAAKVNMISQVAVSVDEFREVAGSYLTVPVNPLGAVDVIDGIADFDMQLVAKCLPSIGAASRNFVWAA